MLHHSLESNGEVAQKVSLRRKHPDRESLTVLIPYSLFHVASPDSQGRLMDACRWNELDRNPSENPESVAGRCGGRWDAT
jgi:hypothetical protein